MTALMKFVFLRSVGAIRRTNMLIAESMVLQHLLKGPLCVCAHVCVCERECEPNCVFPQNGKMVTMVWNTHKIMHTHTHKKISSSSSSRGTVKTLTCTTLYVLFLSSDTRHVYELFMNSNSIERSLHLKLNNQLGFWNLKLKPLSIFMHGNPQINQQ